MVRGIDVVRVIVDADRLGQREDLRNHVIHAEQCPPAVLKVLIDAALRLRSERRPARNRLGPKRAAVNGNKPAPSFPEGTAPNIAHFREQVSSYRVVLGQRRLAEVVRGRSWGMRRPACLPSLLVPRRGLEGIVARFGACLETEDYESVRQDKSI